MIRLRGGIEDPKAWLNIIYEGDYHGKWAGSKINDEGIIQRLKVAQQEAGFDCYVNLADISPTYPRGRKKTRKTDLIGTRWVWADFDPPKPSDDFDLEIWRTETFDALVKCDTVRIHYIIDSGRGFWAVAKLSKQVTPDDGDLVIRAYGQAVTAQTKIDYDRQSVDVSRIIRLPGTTNTKTKLVAQFHEALLPAEENLIDAEVWVEALKEKQQKELEEYKASTPDGSGKSTLSTTLREAIDKFNKDNVYNLNVCHELASQVEHVIGKSSGNYLEWAVEGRTSKSKGGLTCKLASGRFHIHSATLSNRFGIALPSPQASYDLLDMCVMAKFRTGGPTHTRHRTKRVDFLEEQGYYARKKTKQAVRTSIDASSDDDGIEAELEERKLIVDSELLQIAAGHTVPDRLMQETVSIWEENDWFNLVRLMAQKNDVPPAAVLMSTLVRCSAAVGGASESGVFRIGYSEPVPLCLYVILSGPVASGKTMSNKIAKRFSPQGIDGLNDGVNVVSAAGLAETYVIRDKETEHQTDTHTRAIFHYDEGEITSSRTTKEHGLAEGLRDIWSTGTLKQVRAEAKNTRHISNVGIGLTMGIQPGNHCAIIDDQWGLNERTLYAVVRDPYRLSKEDRRAIPDIPEMEQISPRVTTMCLEADDLLEEMRDAVADQSDMPDWAESIARKHGDLNLMKLSALMACIRDPLGMESSEVSIDDFRLGLLLMEMSNAARLLHEQAQTEKRAANQDAYLKKTVYKQRRTAEIKTELLEEDREDAESRAYVNIKKLAAKSDNGITLTEAQRKIPMSGSKAKELGMSISQLGRQILQEMIDDGVLEKRKKRYYLIHEE